jgi:hypothetical protein
MLVDLAFACPRFGRDRYPHTKILYFRIQQYNRIRRRASTTRTLENRAQFKFLSGYAGIYL